MPTFSRRTCLEASLGGALLPAALSATPHPPSKRKNTIKLCEIIGASEASRIRLVKQAGVNYAIAGVSGALARSRREDYVAALTKVKEQYDAVGLKIAGVESHPVPAENIKLGTPQRDEEIENYKYALHALAKVGIPMVCYNFMAGLGWYRTKTDLAERGGAKTSEFNNEDAAKLGLTRWGEISEEKVWANMEYFQKRVIPEAEKAGIQMALHPDDPPISPLRGIGRILTSAKNYERVMAMVPSKINGVTFCQANFRAMGEDPEALAKKWCGQKKIFFVHYRDIEGQGTRFHETFHDNGPTNMARILKIYSDGGFDGPMRPDHAPMMEGEANDRPGYGMTGKIFAFGYMKGIMDALEIPYE
jgi:mannonate dehydratase